MTLAQKGHSGKLTILAQQFLALQSFSVAEHDQKECQIHTNVSLRLELTSYIKIIYIYPKKTHTCYTYVNTKERNSKWHICIMNAVKI